MKNDVWSVKLSEIDDEVEAAAFWKMAREELNALLMELAIKELRKSFAWMEE